MTALFPLFWIFFLELFWHKLLERFFETLDLTGHNWFHRQTLPSSAKLSYVADRQEI